LERNASERREKVIEMRSHLRKLEMGEEEERKAKNGNFPLFLTLTPVKRLFSGMNSFDSMA